MDIFYDIKVCCSHLVFLDFHNVVGNEASVESDREGGYGDLRK